MGPSLMRLHLKKFLKIIANAFAKLRILEYIRLRTLDVGGALGEEILYIGEEVFERRGAYGRRQSPNSECWLGG